ncbi:hypothetical protein J4410_02940 [Candidatus Woesearchaeota archaeon]|nr:hypothetical protein [Candidatus Woesearchaeota archaeon]
MTDNLDAITRRAFLGSAVVIGAGAFLGFPSTASAEELEVRVKVVGQGEVEVTGLQEGYTVDFVARDFQEDWYVVVKKGTETKIYIGSGHRLEEVAITNITPDQEEIRYAFQMGTTVGNIKYGGEKPSRVTYTETRPLFDEPVVKKKTASPNDHVQWLEGNMHQVAKSVDLTLRQTTEGTFVHGLPEGYLAHVFHDGEMQYVVAIKDEDVLVYRGHGDVLQKVPAIRDKKIEEGRVISLDLRADIKDVGNLRSQFFFDADPNQSRHESDKLFLLTPYKVR